MKKIFYLLFIGTIAFGSCTKQDPIEVNITDSTNSLIDTNLIGHWKQTNVNNPNSSSYWNNGQIDLHFFADGTWIINYINGVQPYTNSTIGTYKIHSNKYISFRGPNNLEEDRVFIYSINNGVINFSINEPGLDYVWALPSDDFYGTYCLPSNEYASSNDFSEINNLVKQ